MATDHQAETDRRVADELRREAATMIRLANRIDPPEPTALIHYEMLSAEKAEDLRQSFLPGSGARNPIITEIVTVGLSQGAVMVTAERDRQIRKEGYDPMHDARHTTGELAWAAACYVTRAADTDLTDQDHPAVPTMWPWADREWKPKPDRVRNLVVAAALIVAEIDRTLTEETQ